MTKFFGLPGNPSNFRILLLNEATGPNELKIKTTLFLAKGLNIPFHTLKEKQYFSTVKQQFKRL